MGTSKVCVVTGGAGFIGCAIAPGLLQRYDHVIAFDSLHPQIHPSRLRPPALSSAVELVVGDVTDPLAWRSLLGRVEPELIVHLAAETGTGQSLTESVRHTHVNLTGTATMLDALAAANSVPDQILLTSSRAVYGEGSWQRPEGGGFEYPGQRTREQLAQGIWDFPGMTSVSSDAASTIPRPVSVYAATKLAQENILKAWTSAFGARLKILRLQNVYGPGQALANPYTGIITLFCRLARAGQAIPLYEDGKMLRDFVLIDDVAAAILRAIDLAEVSGKTLDVGTGLATTVESVAKIIAGLYQAPKPLVCGKYRFGDVRHAACDIRPTQDVLGWQSRYSVADGVASLAAWIEAQPSRSD